jgi:hypothetical protein
VHHRWILGSAGLVLAAIAVARADGAIGAEPAAAGPLERASASPLPRLKCRAFPNDPGAEIDTRDAASELGRWVLGWEDEGWLVDTVTFVVGQKPTGYPQGYTHVCMTPVT